MALRLFKIAPGDLVEPLYFIARLAALAPKLRINLTRFHGVFAPNSKYCARVTRAKRGRGGHNAKTADPVERTPAEPRAAMTWAQRLKRVFGIDIETCPTCGGATVAAGLVVGEWRKKRPRKDCRDWFAHPDAVRWSRGRPNAGVDGCDQAIQLAEKAVRTAYAQSVESPVN